MPQLTFDDVPEVKTKEKSTLLDFDDMPDKGTITTLSFDDIPEISPKILSTKKSTETKKEYPIIRQFFKQVFEQAPFGKRILSQFPEREKFYEETSEPKTVQEKVGAGAGSLIGMAPSFAVGGIAGAGVKATTMAKIITKFPRLAKYLASIPAGASTFITARILRNVGENKPIAEGLPQEMVMGGIFGPTGEIRSLPKALVTSAGLGAIVAPKGEKLSNAILFGGLTALTHRKPYLSIQDRGMIDKLYKEAITKEGIRTTKERMQGIQLALPQPKTIYGESFTATQPRTNFPEMPIAITATERKLLPATLLERKAKALGKGETVEGEGFIVKGGKRVPYRKSGYEFRTTPTPEETIQTVSQQAPTIKEKIRPVSKEGVVIVKSDLTPIPQPKPTGEGKVETLSLGGRNFEVKGEKPVIYYRNPQIKEGFGSGWMLASPELQKEIIQEQQLSTPTGGKVDVIKPISIKTPQVEVSQTPKEFYAKIKVGEEWTVPGEGERTFKAGKFITSKSKKMTSEKVIELFRKTIKNFTMSEEGDYLVIRGQGGFMNLDWLKPLEEPIKYAKQAGTQIYRGIAPAGEVLRNDKLVNSIIAERQRKEAEIRSGTLPTSLLKERLQEINDSEKTIQAINKTGDKNESILVSQAADAVDKQRAFQEKYSHIVDLADKVGITKGSKESEIIFKALDYKRATPEEIKTLTPEQQKFIPIFRNAYKEIWRATGKSEYEGIRDYATHLINDGLEKGYDVSPIGKFLPDELYSRFFEKRKGGHPYKQDIVEAFDTYVPNVARKIFREPVLDLYNQKLEPYLSRDFKNEATDYMEAFLGRGKYRYEIGANVPRDLVRLTYQGTLYGNFSAATKNATQVLTNTIPEIGVKNVGYGYKRLMTPEGKAEFMQSGLSSEVTAGKPTDQLDFFSQVEFVNRGVTYLGSKKAWLENHPKDFTGAERYAKKIVRKTQFIQTGVDVPKLYRQFGGVGRALGQFTQFPTKQGFLLYNWARNKEFGKIARFATIAYLLGGTRAFPFLDYAIDKLPDEEKKLVKNVEKYSSLAGLSGMNIGQNFGLGIYSSGVPFARGPVASTVTEASRFGKNIATKDITSLQDIIKSRLVQKTLPTYIKGGVAIKKIIDLINADLNDYKIKNAYNQLQYTSSPKEETLRILVGSTKERKESWESVSEEKKKAEIYRNEHRKMLDYYIESNGDTLGLEEFVKKYPNYNIDNFTKELTNRIKERAMPAKAREYLRRPKALR